MGKYASMLREPVASPTPGYVAGIPQNGLVALWDAGLVASHPGAGTTWTNLVAAPADGSSASAYNLTSTGTSFSGTAGRRSTTESLVFNTATSSALLFPSQTSFLDSFHKDGAAFTFAGVFHFVNVSGAQQFLISFAGGGGVGIQFYLSSGTLVFGLGRGGAGAVTIATSGTMLTAGAKHFIALSLNENGGANASIFYANGAAHTFNGGYTSPSAAAATQVLTLSRNNAAETQATGNTVAMSALWNRALSKTELDQAYDALRGRYPGL